MSRHHKSGKGGGMRGWFALADHGAGPRGTIELTGRSTGWDAPAARVTAPPSAGHGGVRLLIYTQDGLGLGHLRRASSIAEEFLRVGPEGSVLTISDSPLGSLLRGRPHHDYLKLPSIVKAGPGDWRPHSLPMNIDEVQLLRSRLILEAATAFRPDVVLVDHMPHGALGELVPTLDRLRGTATHIVLGVRDIIDAPDVVHQRWRSEGAFDALAAYYDQVLVYGSSDVFDLAAAYGWPADLAQLVRYCGYVCTPSAVDEAGRVRPRRSGASASERMIVAMAGGGADAYALMSAVVEAVPEIREAQACTFVIITGPFMPEAERRDLKQRAEGLPVRLRTMVTDPLKYVAAADLVVAMAGYNTTMEVLRLGTPALLVPRRGPSSEQRMRARRFAERGWVFQLDPDDLSRERLATAVIEALSPAARAHPVARPDLGGIGRAAEQLHAGALAARATVTTRRAAAADVSLLDPAA
jgi:predicted glycosyltransferase